LVLDKYPLIHQLPLVPILFAEDLHLRIPSWKPGHLYDIVFIRPRHDGQLRECFIIHAYYLHKILSSSLQLGFYFFERLPPDFFREAPEGMLNYLISDGILKKLSLGDPFFPAAVLQKISVKIGGGPVEPFYVGDIYIIIPKLVEEADELSKVPEHPAVEIGEGLIPVAGYGLKDVVPVLELG